MFEPFPGFEDLPIPVEIEWQGSLRTVHARVSRWDLSRRVVLVCTLGNKDTLGDWLVVEADNSPYFIGKSHRLLSYRHASDTHTRQRVLVASIKGDRLERLKNIVRSAFAGGQFRVVRFFHLSELPCEPRLTFQSDSEQNWYWQKNYEKIPFRLSSRVQVGGDVPAERVRELLLEEWRDKKSDAYFAWEWAQWKVLERKMLCCGGTSDFKELEQVMLWVLRCSRILWKSEVSWVWVIHPELASRGSVSSPSYSSRHLLLSLSVWQEWLFSYFAPDWRADWLDLHECVWQFWRNSDSLQLVVLDEPPTMHERLEARLELRAWLENKAYPEEREALLSTL